MKISGLRLEGTKLLVGAFALFAFTGVVAANASDAVSFDDFYANPKSAIKITLALKPPSDAAKEKIKRRFPENSLKQKRKTRLVVMKDLLKGVPPEDRAEFLNNLMLKNGKVVSAKLTPLRRTLEEDRINEILDAFSPPRGSKKKNFPKSTTPPRYVRLSELLADVPMKDKSRFLNSLTFKDGVVVSAYVKDLKAAVSEAELKKILGSLQAPISKGSNSALAWCGNNWCDDSACIGDNDRRFSCRFSSGSTCWGSCSSQ